MIKAEISKLSSKVVAAFPLAVHDLLLLHIFRKYVIVIITMIIFAKTEHVVYLVFVQTVGI